MRQSAFFCSLTDGVIIDHCFDHPSDEHVTVAAIFWKLVAPRFGCYLSI